MTKRLLLIAFIFISVKLLAQSPVLSNFRIENSEKSRIYFDSSEPITGTTVNGFYLSDDLRIKVIGLYINPDQRTGHYFVSSEAFDYWDTYAIRYEGGSDIRDLTSNSLHDFWLVEVVNNINEPLPSGTAYYVRTSGSDSNDGLSHESAFKTINRAVKLKAKTVYVEAGDYGVENINFNYSGTSREPIILQGYKTITNGIPDEIEENYWKWGVHGTGLDCVLDRSEMPTLTGNTTVRNTISAAGRAFRTSDFLIIKNFQITRFNTGFFNTSSNNLVLKNINVLYAGRLRDARGYAIFAQGGLQGINAYNKYININTAQGISMIRWYGGATLVDNVKVYNDRAERAPDYYISNYEGSNNIIKNSLVDKIGGSGGAHGIGFKGGDNGNLYPTEYNLVTDCVAINMIAGVELRHSDVKNNVVRNFTAYSRVTDDYSSNGLNAVVIRDESSGNKIENSTFYRQHRGIYFTDQSGEQGVQTPGFDNTFRNILIYDSNNAIGTSGKTSAPLSYGNKFENLTINNVAKVFWTNGSLIMNNTNSLTNSTISNCQKLGVTRIIQNNNNYFGNGVFFTTPSGSSITKDEPEFVNANIGNFHLKPTSPIKDAGIDIANSNYDKDKVERISNKYSIGAYDDAIISLGSVSPDISICVGEDTELVASGGTSYEWNTGETTPNLVVNPVVTTTYSVTVTNGNDSESYDVIVTVNELPTVDLGDDVTICYGDVITLTANGTGDFLWSTGETTTSIEVNPLATETYTVTASNTCTTQVSDEIIVTVSPDIALTVTSDVTICSIGESIELTATGNGDFLWSTGETTESITVSPSESTTYRVTSNLGGCNDFKEVIVSVNESPSVDAGVDISICEGDMITLTATGVGDFLWSTGETTESIDVSPSTTTTYTVVASNSCSSDANDEVVVTVNPRATVNLGSDVAICSGESIELIATGTGDFLWSTGETGTSITVSPTEDTVYTVTSTLGDCPTSDDIEVLVNQPPSVNAGEDISICSTGDAVELTATGTGNFLWSNGETTATITVNPSITTTYTVTTSNSCTTDATDEVTVTVFPELVLDISQDVTICSVGETVQLTASGNGNFLWNTGETTESISVSPSNTTTYTVTSSIGNCLEESRDVTVTVNEEASVDAGNDVSICYGDNITLTAIGVGDFLWSTGETTASIEISPTTTTTYSVTASNSCTASITDDVIVTVTPNYTVNAGSDVSICTGESITLTATGIGNFLWSTGETTASINVSPTSSRTYSVSSGSGPCAVNDAVRVTVNQAASVNAGSDVSVCFDESVTLTATGTGDFLWSTGETSASITVNPSSTTAYTVTASNSCTADATDEVIVNVAPDYAVNVGSDVLMCLGETIELTATGTGDFLWNTGATTASISVSPTSTRTYTVTAGSGRCAKTDAIRVTVNKPASVDAGDDVTICYGDNVILTAVGNGDLLWSTGETTKSITVNPLVTTTYNVSVSNNSCTDSESDDIIVNVKSEININAGEDVSICSGDAIELTATGPGDFLWSTGETTASITVNPSETTTYKVSTTVDGCTDEDFVDVVVNTKPEVIINGGENVSICSGDTVELTVAGSGDFLWSTGETTASITVNPSETITYTVSRTVNGCTNEGTVEVVIGTKPEIVINGGENVSICSGESIELTATGSGDFLWSTGETTASISVSPSETETYTVSTTVNGCSNEDSIEVIVNSIPSLSVSSDVSIEAGVSVELTATGTGDFLWSTGETGSSISVSPSNTTTYSVTLTNSLGCSDQENIIVTVGSEESFVANAGADVNICPKSSSAILTATGGDSYLWSTGQTTASITVNPSKTTIYSVIITKGNAQIRDEVTVFFDENCNNIVLAEEMLVYPNPTNGLLNIRLSGIQYKMTVSLFNLSGQMVYSKNFEKPSNGQLNHQIDLARFGKGVYIVRVSNRYKTSTKKVLVI